jgi:hypothetical protein
MAPHPCSIHTPSISFHSPAVHPSCTHHAGSSRCSFHHLQSTCRAHITQLRTGAASMQHPSTWRAPITQLRTGAASMQHPGNVVARIWCTPCPMSQPALLHTQCAEQRLLDHAARPGRATGPQGRPIYETPRRLWQCASFRLLTKCCLHVCGAIVQGATPPAMASPTPTSFPALRPPGGACKVTALRTRGLPSPATRTAAAPKGAPRAASTAACPARLGALRAGTRSVTSQARKTRRAGALSGAAARYGSTRTAGSGNQYAAELLFVWYRKNTNSKANLPTPMFWHKVLQRQYIQPNNSTTKN